MAPKLMPDWETSLRQSFGNRNITPKNIDALHHALEQYSGEQYVPKEKTLTQKIQYIINLARHEDEWDARSMQCHLYFFHQTKYNMNTISGILMKLHKRGTLERIERGIYRKA